MIRSILLIVAVLTLSIGLTNASSEITFHVTVDKVKLHPGDNVVITLLIENEGTVSGFYLNESTATALQLVTTAKDLRVEVEDNYIPIEVESTNPVLIGDLPAGRVAKAAFKVKVDENAKLGEYKVPVRLKYTKVEYSSVGTGVIVTYSTDNVDTEYVTINITKRDYDFSVISIDSNLKTNRKCIVSIIIKNTGLNKICDAVLILNTTPPLITDPKAMSAYLGDLNPDQTAKAEFKIYVTEGALNQTYPATLILKFKTTGKIPIILTQQIGLKVLREDVFEVLNVESLITAPKFIPKQRSSTQMIPTLQPFMQTKQQSSARSGFQHITIPSRGFVRVTIKANEDMYDAIAMLSFEDPTIQAENHPYLGHLKRGDTKQALFYIKAMAPAGEYRACLILKYKNSFGDEVVSERHHFKIIIDSSESLKIVKVEARNVGVGLNGELVVDVKNEMEYSIRDITFFIISPESTITPISSSYFIGELKPGEIGRAKFRLSVSGDAVSGFHRLYVVERYDLGDAEDFVSVTEIPVFVESKMAYFEVLSIQSDLYPDETGDVIVKIRNAGSLTVHNAVVKLELNPPLTIAGGSSLSSLIGVTQPGLYFVGTIKPGDIALARFKVHVDKDAGAGFYPVNVIVEYYDDEGYKHTSSPITASVEVKKKPLITPLIATAIALAVIGLIIAGRFAKGRLKREKG